MISLGGDSLSGRLFKGSILLEGFMIGFHVPSFAIDSGDILEGQGGIAGHQIQNTDAAIFVCEDLLDQPTRGAMRLRQAGDCVRVSLIHAS